MDPAAYARFTAALTARLEMDPDVVGLVALGSMSGEPPGPDAWSDHDFFVVTRPGAQERLRADPAWLPEAGRLVLWHRETAHGLKAVWDDGHLAELAVFDPDELALARVNRYRVLLDRADVAARIAAVRSATAARHAAESPDPRWLGGQFLSELLVGAGRAARGERTSGHLRVRSQALVHLLQLVHRLVPPAEGAVPDFDFIVSSLEARERAAAPVTVFGLTYMLRHEVVRPLLSRGLVFHLPAGSSVVHIGGWKRLEQARVARALFIGDVCAVFGVAPERVFDFYGFTEQMGLVYGGAGLEPKAVPAYAEVLVRDPRTLAPAPDGAPGLLQVLTPLPHSHPGVSVLTDDIARIVSRGANDDGRYGTRFELLGRVEGAEPRGCGDLESPAGH